MNGTFKVSLATPMGTYNGTVKFLDQNGVLSGSLHAMGSDNPFVNGKVVGNNFEFAGTIKIGFNKFEYTAKGTVTGDILKADASTKFGIMKIKGTRIQ